MKKPKENASAFPLLQISSAVLNHNLRLIKKKIDDPKCKILIPIKANAYGCGIETLLPFFLKSGAINMLGVANVFEGIMVRKNKWKKPILLLGSFFEADIKHLFQENIIPCLTDPWQIKALDSSAQREGLKKEIHIKLDLGMGRLGFLEGQVYEMVERLKNASSLSIKGIMTHFPQTKKRTSLDQLKRFLKVAHHIITDLGLKRNGIILHAANSGAILNYPSSALDMVRPGLCFYGYFQTFEDKKRYGKFFNVKPSLRLTAHAFSQKNLPKGSFVSYGSTFEVKKDQYPVGVFPIGYGDGIPVALSNRIAFEGKPLLGRVTMDQIILGGIKKINQKIELLGEKSPPLEYWAQRANTISYEIMTGLGQRLRRKLVP